MMLGTKRVLFLFGILLIVSVPACCSKEPTPPQPPSERALAAEALLSRMEQDPGSPKLRQDFLRQFSGIFENESVDWPRISPATYTIYGTMLSRAYEMARAGCQPCLQAIMRASQGPLGRTAHGSEMLAEMLWDMLWEQTQFSLDALAALPPAERRAVFENVYAQPPHDGYDFCRMLVLLKQVRVPPNMNSEFAEIAAVVARDAAIQSRRLYGTETCRPKPESR